MTEILHRELIYYLQGLGFQIHTALGGGHAELDYENALVHALHGDETPFLRQPLYNIQYKNRMVGRYYPDLMVAHGKVLIELKAARQIESLHVAQTLSYLAVTGAELGLIMNFGGSAMQFKRVPNFLQRRRPAERSGPLMDKSLYPQLSQSVLDGLFEVHRTLGAGFLHQVYRRAARLELQARGLSVQLIKQLPLRFQGSILAQKAVRLLLIEDKLLVATVALTAVTPAQSEKLRWAMRALGIRLGLIANFYPSPLAIQFYRQKADSPANADRSESHSAR